MCPSVRDLIRFLVVFVLMLSVSSAAAEEKLWASDPYGWNVFGYATAIDGDTAVIGSYAYDDLGPPSVPDVGSVDIFQWDDLMGAWVEVNQLFASDAAEGNRFGYSVAISGDIVLVGAYGDDHSVAEGGAAYVFYRDQGGPDSWNSVTP